MTMTKTETFSFVVGPEYAGQRLDLYLVDRLQGENLTRSRIKGLLQDGLVLVGNEKKKAGYLLRGAEEISVLLPEPAPTELVAEAVDFNLLYEDEDVIVVSKPPGVVVHPSCGHASGTLVHGLLHRCGTLSGISGELRPGIVHRLDKDTSGAMVVAKNDLSHHSLVAQFKAKQVQKIYHAIVDGRMPKASGTIDLPVGRHPVQRKKMAVRDRDGREAVTHWRLLESFAVGYSFIEVRLETGRTHQIRVHMAALGHPVAGDAVYGKKNKNTALFRIKRQCLHSSALSFDHPRTREKMHFRAPLWPDIAATLQLLRAANGVFLDM